MKQSNVAESPEFHTKSINQIELAYFEWGKSLRGVEPSILFAHATGFHARVWDQVIGLIGKRHVIAVDLRGHGRSEKTPIDHWRLFGEDLAALVRELDLRGAIGVGHSMGGHALTEAAAACPGAFRRLLLVDPVIASASNYTESGWSASQLGDAPHPTSRRKNRFASPEAMFERFKDRSPYSVFEPAALFDYCKYGLIEDRDAGEDQDRYVLACPPEIEASIYMTARSNHRVYDSVRAIEIPVMIMRARSRSDTLDSMDFSASPTWPGLVGEFQNAREVYLPEQTHFLPMESPKLVAKYVLQD